MTTKENRWQLCNTSAQEGERKNLELVLFSSFHTQSRQVHSHPQGKGSLRISSEYAAFGATVRTPVQRASVTLVSDWITTLLQ